MTGDLCRCQTSVTTAQPASVVVSTTPATGGVQAVGQMEP